MTVSKSAVEISKTQPNQTNQLISDSEPPKEENDGVSAPKSSCSDSSFAIQSPVSRFHTDSTHTAFINLWLPMAPVQNDPLAFLYHWPSKQLLTAALLETLLSQEPPEQSFVASSPSNHDQKNQEPNRPEGGQSPGGGRNHHSAHLAAVVPKQPVRHRRYGCFSKPHAVSCMHPR